MSATTATSSPPKKPLNIAPFLSEEGGESWMTSDLIDAYTGELKMKGNPEFAYLHQITKEKPKDTVRRIEAVLVGTTHTVVFPYLDKDHFRLLIVGKNQAMHYDSKNEELPKWGKTMKDLLNRRKFIEDIHPVQKKHDKDNCGIFVMLKVKHVMDGSDGEWTQADAEQEVKEFRKKAVLELHEHFELFNKDKPYHPTKRISGITTYHVPTLSKESERKAVESLKRSAGSNSKNKEPPSKKNCDNDTSSSRLPATEKEEEKPSMSANIHPKTLDSSKTAGETGLLRVQYLALKDDVEDKKKELEKLKNEKKEVEDREKNLQVLMEKKNLEIVKLKDQEQASKDEKKAQETQMRKLKEDLKSQKAASEDLDKKNQNEIVKKNQEVEKLRADMKIKNEVIAELENEKKKANEDKEKQEIELKDLKEQMTTKNAEPVEKMNVFATILKERELWIVEQGQWITYTNSLEARLKESSDWKTAQKNHMALKDSTIVMQNNVIVEQKKKVEDLEMKLREKDAALKEKNVLLEKTQKERDDQTKMTEEQRQKMEIFENQLKKKEAALTKETALRVKTDKELGRVQTALEKEKTNYKKKNQELIALQKDWNKMIDDNRTLVREEQKKKIKELENKLKEKDAALKEKDDEKSVLLEKTQKELDDQSKMAEEQRQKLEEKETALNEKNILLEKTQKERDDQSKMTEEQRQKIEIFKNQLKNKEAALTKETTLREKADEELGRVRIALEKEKTRSNKKNQDLIALRKDWNEMADENKEFDRENKKTFNKITRERDDEKKQKEKLEKAFKELCQDLERLKDLEAKTRSGSADLPDFRASGNLQNLADQRIAKNSVLNKKICQMLQKLKLVGQKKQEEEETITLD